MNSLKGIKVLELAGLAPGPYAGKILKDFGATVIRIEKYPNEPISDVFEDGKLRINVDLKQDKGQTFVRNLCKQADVLIDPYRAGILEKMNLNPVDLLKINKRLIVARLTGYGQLIDGIDDEHNLAKRSGHDINYIALSGLLSQFTSDQSNKPVFPINLLGDFAGGGLMCAFGICLSLLERERTGKGQIIDSNMTESSSYIGSWLFRTRKPGTFMQHLVWPNLDAKHANMLDGGQPFYDCYECKDGKFMALGALEIKFFEEFISNLSKSTKGDDQFKEFQIDKIEQFDDDLKAKLSKIFKLKTRDEWSAIFLSTDSCCTPVLEPEEVHNFEYFKARKSFLDPHTPNTSPRFLADNEQTEQKTIVDLANTLDELKIDKEELADLLKGGILKLNESKL